MSIDHVTGSLLGAAVGDALGLPYEGLSPRRAVRLLGAPNRFRFVFGWGMVSDDTEHTCMAAQALLCSDGNVDAFRVQLGRRFRFWLLGLPAGIGLATLRAILKLWIGFDPRTSGGFSAGNGPCMRAGILGAAITDGALLREMVAASSRITHTDPKAEYAALAIALAARLASEGSIVAGKQYTSELRSMLPEQAGELISLIDRAVGAVNEGQSTQEFAEMLGLQRGVTGYAYHTAPVVIHAWLANQRDFRSAVTAVILCGGDADSTASIVGSIVGAGVGKQGIPSEWIQEILEWPRSVGWMERLGNQLGAFQSSTGKPGPVELPMFCSIPRNILFMLVVLFHGFRRLFPPY